MKPTLCLVLMWIGVFVGHAAGAADGSVADGKVVFDRWCSGCHAPTSDRRKLLAGTYALEQRYKGTKPAALEQRTDLSPDLIKSIVRNGLNVMPRTRKTEVSDQQLDALARYLASSHG
jgi:(+)-pinoresinol hydroxylase